MANPFRTAALVLSNPELDRLRAENERLRHVLAGKLAGLAAADEVADARAWSFLVDVLIVAGMAWACGEVSRG